MNCVLDEAEEVYVKKNQPQSTEKRTYIGRIMLKGDNISLICGVQDSSDHQNEEEDQNL